MVGLRAGRWEGRGGGGGGGESEHIGLGGWGSCHAGTASLSLSLSSLLVAAIVAVQTLFPYEVAVGIVVAYDEGQDHIRLSTPRKHRSGIVGLSPSTTTTTTMKG